MTDIVPDARSQPQGRVPAIGGPVGELVRAGRADSGAGYYDVPMLNPPVWEWEVAGYFFLGGLSAGSYLIARMAERFGGKPSKAIARAGTNAAFVSFLPCAPLLILDLGDRSRFHHMLRVFKPTSPMNLGAWVLTGYGSVLTLAALREFLDRNGSAEDRRLPVRIADAAVGGLADAAGVPLAMLLAAYPGVLLSTTATPVWARNPWLGPLFTTGALSTGAAAVRLALPPAPAHPEPGEEGPIEKIEVAGRLAEAAALTGYLVSAGKRAEPLTKGKYAPHVWGGVVGAGIVLPGIGREVAKRARRAAPWLRLAGAAMALAGGFALRWALVYAGHASANDPEADREVGRRGT